METSNLVELQIKYWILKNGIVYPAQKPNDKSLDDQKVIAVKNSGKKEIKQIAI
jgi:hypothetical protein